MPTLLQLCMSMLCAQVYLHLRLEAQRRRQQRDFQAEYVQVRTLVHMHHLLHDYACHAHCRDISLKGWPYLS